jgi:predicted phosphodiesterase
MSLFLSTSIPIACWIYGHTHAPSVTSVYGVPMLCNPMGYPGENSEVNFQKVFEVGGQKFERWGCSTS